MPAAAHQGQPIRQGLGLAFPENDRRVGAHDPFAVGCVQVDGRIKGPAPFDHRRIIMRVRDGDGGYAPQRFDLGDGGLDRSRLMQSHRTLPPGVCTSSARCPMEKEGLVPIPVRPGSTVRMMLWWSCCRASSVVHCWPLPAHVLALILTDRAAAGRLRRRGKLRAAGLANISRGFWWLSVHCYPFFSGKCVASMTDIFYHFYKCL